MPLSFQPRNRYPFGGDPATEAAGAVGQGGGASSKENVGLSGFVNDGGERERRAPLPDPRRLVAVLQEMSSRKRERRGRVSAPGSY